MKRGKIVKSKRSQQIMGMPFLVIFSIILIVVFIVVAFIAIKHFLSIGDCGEVGLFLEDFQNEVDGAWNSEASDFYFESSLPSGIKYVCFANLSLAESSGISSEELEIFEEMEKYRSYNANLFLYPPGKACEMEYKKIKHIQIPEKNPYCISVENGKIKIKIEKSFEDALVKIS